MNYSLSAPFRAAGYQDIQVNSSYVGGQVRQHGNFSFSRVYEAGHEGTSSGGLPRGSHYISPLHSSLTSLVMV